MAENSNITLRKLKTEDIDQLVEQGNDYDVHYNSFFLMKYPFGKKEAVEVIDEDKKVKNMQRFGIDLGGKIIGLLDLYNLREAAPVLHSSHSQESSSARGKLKLGYWIGKNYRRKGYATEAIKRMIKYAFENFDVDEIIATTLVTNEASMNLLKKLGFEKGKVLKNDRFLDGKYIDSVQWTMKKGSKTNT